MSFKDILTSKRKNENKLYFQQIIVLIFDIAGLRIWRSFGLLHLGRYHLGKAIFRAMLCGVKIYWTSIVDDQSTTMVKRYFLNWFESSFETEFQLEIS